VNGADARMLTACPNTLAAVAWTRGTASCTGCCAECKERAQGFHGRAETCRSDHPHETGCGRCCQGATLHTGQGRGHRGEVGEFGSVKDSAGFMPCRYRRVLALVTAGVYVMTAGHVAHRT
jgi:hypothetical protein